MALRQCPDHGIYISLQLLKYLIAVRYFYESKCKIKSSVFQEFKKYNAEAFQVTANCYINKIV